MARRRTADRALTAGQLTLLAVGAESLLAAGAAAWIRWRAIPTSWTEGPWMLAVAAGLAAAGVLALVNRALLCHAPDFAGVRSIRRLYRDTLRPQFATAGLRDVVLISVAAGVGEELLFRGALQAEAGLAAASVVFGLLHIGGRASVVFGGWVMVMGAGLGWLAAVTGGLLAPIVAHTVYDAAAIAYCRWGPVCGAVRRLDAPGGPDGTARTGGSGQESAPTPWRVGWGVRAVRRRRSRRRRFPG